MPVLLISLAVLLLIGVPIAYSLGISGMLYFVVHQPALLEILPQRVFAGMDTYAMVALALFVLMGLVMNEGGMTTRLIDFSLVFVGRFRGGLGLVNVFASMIFGGISGSSVSDTASVGAVLIPQMRRKGYSAEFASGITVASSTMGMIIPPSVPMVIYALVSEQSVGRLFLGSLIPGVTIGVLMLGITFLISTRKRYPKEEIAPDAKEVWTRLRKGLVAIAMPVFVIGSVVLGIATATESAGIGVLYAIVVGVFVIRGFKLSALPRLLKQSAMTSATVMIIIALSNLYIWILALERIPLRVATFLGGLELPAFAIILAVNAVILLTGTFVDVTPAILLLTPVFLPAMVALGMSPIQFGVLLISGLAVGLVTPPVGICLNVASAISKLPLGAIFKAALPFLVANAITLLLISFFRPFTLWLPNILMGGAG